MTETNYKEVYIENKLDYNKFLLDPKIEQQHAEITKDMALSHLDATGLLTTNMRQEIIGIISLWREWMPNSFSSFVKDQFSFLQLSRSKHGFESKLQRSNLTGDSTNTGIFEREKAKTIFEQKTR